VSDADADAARTLGESTLRSRADARRPHAEALLEVAVEAAMTAGALLAERMRRGAERDIASKSTPTDLVSEADLASERAIRELLAERRPDDGFVGEEGDRVEGSSGLSWVVDPLDGTVNFLFGIPQWCVSVAVRDERSTIAGAERSAITGAERSTIAGAIYDPNRDELFTAVRGGRAKLVGPGGAMELGRSRVAGGGGDSESGPGLVAAGSRGSDLGTAMVATGLAYDADVRAAQGRVLAPLVSRVRDIRRFGSAALDLAWTAAGRFDAYFERTVKPWDIAAGTLLCEAAGLRVAELPEREGLPWGIVVASPALCEELLGLIL
jgi:myo-inositol-1(or 4)-monophosphatase